VIWGDWNDKAFLEWVNKISRGYESTRFSLLQASRKCATIVSRNSDYYRVLCYGCSRRLILILEAFDNIFEVVPLNSILRTKALKVKDRNRLELMYHALLVNISGTMDNCMLLLSMFYKFGFKPVEIQFFQKNTSRFYSKLKSRNKDLYDLLSSLKYKHRDDLQQLRNTTCHRFVPYYPEYVKDMKGYNSFIEKWNEGIRDRKITISLDDNPFELNGGWIAYEDFESEGFYYTSLHDSVIRYCDLMLEIVNSTTHLLE